MGRASPAPWTGRSPIAVRRTEAQTRTARDEPGMGDRTRIVAALRGRWRMVLVLESLDSGPLGAIRVPIPAGAPRHGRAPLRSMMLVPLPDANREVPLPMLRADHRKKVLRHSVA